jgi:hypothetical protein
VGVVDLSMLEHISEERVQKWTVEELSFDLEHGKRTRAAF